MDKKRQIYVNACRANRRKHDEGTIEMELSSRRNVNQQGKVFFCHEFIFHLIAFHCDFIEVKNMCVWMCVVFFYSYANITYFRFKKKLTCSNVMLLYIKAQSDDDVRIGKAIELIFVGFVIPKKIQISCITTYICSPVSTENRVQK